MTRGFRLHSVIAMLLLVFSANERAQPTALAYLAGPVEDESRFCSRQGADWMVRSYPPLIDTVAGTEVLQFAFTGVDRHLEHLYLKRYTDRYELFFDYKFDENGRLSGLHGMLRRWGHWMAEADLFPDPDSSTPRPDITYRLSQHGGIVSVPPEGPDYVRHFNEVKVYRTTRELPCQAAIARPGG